MAVQASFDDLGTHLSQVTFCVVDLETTGGAETDMITEVGAVKVRGGEVLGEFQTLVNPKAHIPPLIAVLTGITNQMVANAPGLRHVLPSFLAFAQGTVLVAPNAPFDVGFLTRACARHWRDTFTRPSRRTTGRSPMHRRRLRDSMVCSNGSAILAYTPSRIWLSSAGRCHHSGAPSAPGPPPYRPCPGSISSSPSTAISATFSMSASPRTFGPECATTSRRLKSGRGSTRWSGWLRAWRPFHASPSCR